MEMTTRNYEKRMVTAPAWMEKFACTAEACPETCCQQWNIDVDPAHARLFRELDDPELSRIMGLMLRSMRTRRPGSKTPSEEVRLMLLSTPDKRCAFLNEEGKCRLQKKYGAHILCDTCYFHPRDFWQIDEATYMSACLSCPECARLALIHPDPVRFARFEAEIDPKAEWLETELARSANVRGLLRNREALIRAVCGILQDRKLPVSGRIRQVICFYEKLAALESVDESAIQKTVESVLSITENRVEALSGRERMRLFLDIFDPQDIGREKAAQEASRMIQELSVGREDYLTLLATHYRDGMEICGEFLSEQPWLEEHFLVHCVFSDGFKQFYRYQNDYLELPELLHHEAALLTAWDWVFHARLSAWALKEGRMDEEIFLRAVCQMDRSFWHYPDWFARAADRMKGISPGILMAVSEEE